MNKYCLALIVLASGPIPADAETFRAINWLNVNPISKTEFEVVLQPGASPRAVWCAASDYSGKRLGHYNKTDLVVKTAVGPSVTQTNRKGVTFSIIPKQDSDATSKSYSVTIKKVGATLSVGHAHLFCPFLPGPFFD